MQGQHLSVSAMLGGSAPAIWEDIGGETTGKIPCDLQCRLSLSTSFPGTKVQVPSFCGTLEPHLTHIKGSNCSQVTVQIVSDLQASLAWREH